jgi:hypothetical protein
MTTDSTITPELLDQLLANYTKPEDLTGVVNHPGLGGAAGVVTLMRARCVGSGVLSCVGG